MAVWIKAIILAACCFVVLIIIPIVSALILPFLGFILAVGVFVILLQDTPEESKKKDPKDRDGS